MLSHIFTLPLANSNRWGVFASNDTASVIAAKLGAAMKLAPLPDIDHRLHVCIGRDFKSYCSALLARKNNRPIVCTLFEASEEDVLAFQIQLLSVVIARQVQIHGGILLHGALAEWEIPNDLETAGSYCFKQSGSSVINGSEKSKYGIILAGRSGIGKSSTSMMLSSPWRSLCDDTTLVVRDDCGKYWAHPWPTWSRFLFGGTGGSWDVAYAVPLKGVFFLEQSVVNKAEILTNGEAAPRMVAAVEQASRLMTHRLQNEETKKIHLEWLDNACALAKTVPSYNLQFSLNGAFWKEIEKVFI